MAQDALVELALERVLFVPAGLPPHKREAESTAAELRLEMTRAAVAGDARFEVDALEVERAGPSYTVDTLRALRERRPDDELLLLIGADQFREFATWKDAAEIARLASLVVIGREGALLDAAAEALRREGLDPAWRRLDATRIDVSSTLVRQRVAAGRPIRYLVPDAVAAIIDREGLYRRDR